MSDEMLKRRRFVVCWKVLGMHCGFSWDSFDVLCDWQSQKCTCLYTWNGMKEKERESCTGVCLLSLMEIFHSSSVGMIQSSVASPSPLLWRMSMSAVWWDFVFFSEELY